MAVEVSPFDDRHVFVRGIDLSGKGFDELFGGWVVPLDRIGEIEAPRQEVTPRRVESLVNLMPHQEIGVSFLMEQRSAALADEMGLGKSGQAAIAAASIGGSVLVLCPSSLTRNWCREYKKFTGREMSAKPNGRAYAASYDQIKTDTAAARQVFSQVWDVLILDEAHYLRNARSKRYKAAARVNARHKWALTGTPLVNRPADATALFGVTNHPMRDEADRYNRMFRSASPEQAGQYVATLLRGWMLRRTKEDAIELPDKGVSEVYVDASPYRPRKVQEIMRARMALAVEKARHTSEMALDAIRGGEKVIVFSSFLEPLRALKMAAENEGIGVAQVTGSMARSARDAAGQKFQTDDDCKLFLGQIHAAGVGLTLTAGSVVLFNDLDWKPATHLQAMDRSHRIGQKNRVLVRYVIGDCPLDQATWRLLCKKQGMVDAFEEAISAKELLDEMEEQYGR